MRIKARKKYKVNDMVLVINSELSGYAHWHRILAVYDNELLLVSSPYGTYWVSKEEVATETEVAKADVSHETRKEKS